MPLLELLLLALLVMGAWLWLDSLKARAIALAAARTACRAENLQLLDETVANTRLGLARDEAGRLQLRRVYAFEYSISGMERRTGSLVLLGHQVLVLTLHETPDTGEAPTSASEAEIPQAEVINLPARSDRAVAQWPDRQ